MCALAAILGLALALPACARSSGYPFLTNRNPNADYVRVSGPRTGRIPASRSSSAVMPARIMARSSLDVAMQYEAQGQLPVTTEPTVSVERGAWEPD